MKITIIDGIDVNSISDEMAMLNNNMQTLSTQNDTTIFNVNDLNIHHCNGCWSCWLKTPGNCVFNDDMIDIYKSIVKSDLLIFVSALKAGLVESSIKKVMDRMFALLLPHMTVVEGQLHHIPRYDKQPKLGLVIMGQKDYSKEQDEILKEFMYRFSLNFNHGTGNFVHYYNSANSKELINEINNI